jgi:hypothetical protein
VLPGTAAVCCIFETAAETCIRIHGYGVVTHKNTHTCTQHTHTHTHH